MKKISIALATLAVGVFSAPLFAKDTVSSLVDNMYIKGGLTFTEAAGNGTDFFYQNASSAEDCCEDHCAKHRKVFSLHPDKHLDYTFGLGYHFPCTNTDLVLEYDHFKDTTRRHEHPELAGVAYPSNFTVNAGNSVKATVRYDEKDWRLGLRHTVHQGARFDAVFGAFIEYLNLNRNFHSQFADSTGIKDVYTYETVKGWGPYFDVNAKAYICGGCAKNLNLFAHLGVGFLNTSDDYKLTAYNSEKAIDTSYSLCAERNRHLVLKMDAEVGAEMRCVFHNTCPDLQFSARAGLKYLDHVNVFKGANVNLGTGSFNIPMNPVGDYSRVGPFLEFTIGGANSR